MRSATSGQAEEGRNGESAVLGKRKAAWKMWRKREKKE
jgi:hypothetical protein